MTPSDQGVEQSGVTLGIDFGTTNTVLSVAAPDGTTAVLSVPKDGVEITGYRSILCFWQDRETGERTAESGPWAVDAFVNAPHSTRMLQSFKTFAASKSFKDTPVFGRRFKFEDILQTFLETVAAKLGDRLPPKGNRVVIGRPVIFAGNAPDEALAMLRYEKAFRAFGFTDIHYVYEPVAAAYFYAQQLTADSNVLVADFGGGTSDFSIVRFEVGKEGLRFTPLRQTGLGIAGDTFDYRIIDNAVSPLLGKGTEYESFGKRLTVPNYYYANFARWNTLFLMNSPATIRELDELARQAVDPKPLESFIHLIENDYGYEIYRAVSELKVRLSSQHIAELHFKADDFEIRSDITRNDFENWIDGDVRQIERSVQQAVEKAGLASSAIDRVFLTGGTSFVPVIRTVFESRFPDAMVTSSNQFDSIANGLALIGQSGDIDRWSV
ncbi:molecular chaperone Hsp70 [Brucella abortus]|uniref:Hsp70 family protein n=1 Tax=Brucella abortus TaxID=235 RepID=A0AAE9IIY3_BRUAO|nr:MULTISPECIES: Hsp70 family protein [Brucella]ALF29043.1 molecular chaperone Hsp70 [Brucella abortus 104M]ASZ86959.1 Hsp70 family protein [Brucella abortus]ASZ89869.1 Hsp70 family protein [Brucella abortus]ASZ92853.1 Hsp70 family protein [Brucella abortus]ASZ98679.1 Hsp70 family protein [Brucella abortus]